jgi:rhodanese-related sulfurtransferase
MMPTTIRKQVVQYEKNPKEAEKEAEATGMADHSLLLDDRVVFHDVSYFSNGVGSLPSPGSLAVYPNWADGNNPGYPSRLAVVALARRHYLVMKRYVAVMLLLVGIFLLAACQPGDTPVVGKQVEVQGGAYTEISVDELHSMLKNKDFELVNVHIPFEGDIPNTDVSIPFDQIAQNLDQLPAVKNAKIVLYCRSDRMSTIASETLVGLGFTNVYNLDGGMVAWENAGLDLER